LSAYIVVNPALRAVWCLIAFQSARSCLRLGTGLGGQGTIADAVIRQTLQPSPACLCDSELHEIRPVIIRQIIKIIATRCHIL